MAWYMPIRPHPQDPRILLSIHYRSHEYSSQADSRHATEGCPCAGLYCGEWTAFSLKVRNNIYKYCKVERALIAFKSKDFKWTKSGRKLRLSDGQEYACLKLDPPLKDSNEAKLPPFSGDNWQPNTARHMETLHGFRDTTFTKIFEKAKEVAAVGRASRGSQAQVVDLSDDDEFDPRKAFIDISD